jgi:DNA polymerase III subunit alpha
MGSYRLVESYAADDTTVFVGGRSYPAPSLVEGDDGVRVMLLAAGQERIRVEHWVRANASGVGLLLQPHREDPELDLPGPDWRVVTAEEFIERRVEHPRTAEFEQPSWWPWDGEPPSYTELIENTGSLCSGFGARPGRREAERPPARFVHLHTHTEYSALDGLSTVEELVAAAVADGQPAQSSTDHGNVSSHPALQRACDAAGIKAIFGMEGYFQPDRFRRSRTWVETDPETGKEVKRSDAKEALYGYWHLTLLAQTQQGLRNLWAMSSESYRDGNYDGKPRLDWDTLERLNEGVIAGTGCLGGPICQALLDDDEEEARLRLARLLEIFDDRLYVELVAIDIPDQRRVNPQLVRLAREFGVPMIATVDSHYTHAHEKETHRTWLLLQPSVKEDSYLVTEHNFEHARTADEVEAALAYLGAEVVAEAMANTVRIAESCTARVEGELERPVYSRDPVREDAVRHDEVRLREMAMANWGRKVAGKGDEAVYRARFEREMGLLVSQMYCGYYLVTADLCREAKRRRILMGPCRGSGGASLVAYLVDITEVDPVAADMPFERFLTEERTDMPDFDMDFPASRRGELQQYLRERWGEDRVVLVGNHIRTAPKLAINDAVRALRGRVPYEVDPKQMKVVTEAIDDYAAGLAGATPKWDDIWEQVGHRIEPVRQRYPEVFELAGIICRRLKSYGTHASGVVISTSSSLADLPTRTEVKDGRVIKTVTQFDYRDLAELGYIKYDLLTLRTLDTIQVAIDLIRERRGREVDIYGWREEYDDPQVWGTLAAGHTLGVFQIEKKGGVKMTKRVKPASIADLSAINALNRPGPQDSGLAETYLRRRFGEEPVSYPDPRLEPVLAETYGAIVYQEQVMQAAVVLAGYSLGEADTKIRKILGKKLVEKAEEAGREFIRRAVEHGTDRAVAEALWAQISSFARYSFNKAHSWGYAVLGYWAGWLKEHYPLEFLTAVLSTVKADRVPEFVVEARRMGYAVLPPDVNESGPGFAPTELAVRYGLESVAGVGPVPAQLIVANRPYTSVEDFLARLVEPKGSKVNAGHVKVLAAVGAFDGVHPNRRQLERQLALVSDGADRRCRHRDDSVALGEDRLPCAFDWASEPDPPMVVKGPKGAKVSTPKPPPKRCTSACRQHSPVPLQDLVGEVAPYTAEDIRQRERAMLKVYLSSTPFDRLQPEDRELLHTVEQIEAGEEGEYVVAGIIGRVHVVHKGDKFGRVYAWVTLETESGLLECSCWADAFERYRQDLVEDSLVLAVVWKDSRGTTITGLAPA